MTAARALLGLQSAAGNQAVCRAMTPIGQTGDREAGAGPVEPHLRRPVAKGSIQRGIGEVLWGMVGYGWLWGGDTAQETDTGAAEPVGGETTAADRGESGGAGPPAMPGLAATRGGSSPSTPAGGGATRSRSGGRKKKSKARSASTAPASAGTEPTPGHPGASLPPSTPAPSSTGTQAPPTRSGPAHRSRDRSTSPGRSSGSGAWQSVGRPRRRTETAEQRQARLEHHADDTIAEAEQAIDRGDGTPGTTSGGIPSRLYGTNNPIHRGTEQLIVDRWRERGPHYRAYSGTDRGRHGGGRQLKLVKDVGGVQHIYHVNV